MIYHIYARGDEAPAADSQSRLCIIKHTLFHAGFFGSLDGWRENQTGHFFRAAPRGNSRGRCSLTFYAQEKQEEEVEVVVEREKIRLLSA